MDALRAETFYGDKLRNWHAEFYSRAERNASTWTDDTRKMRPNLMGPTQFWQEFPKQADALSTASDHFKESNELCTFVYQDVKGTRRFVVAHPEVYWWYDQKKRPEERCSYEVIPEGTPCKLYLDLEFSKSLNPKNCGPRMTDTFLEVCCAYLLKNWQLPCTKNNVISLDSSTGEKFSRHLIFNTKDIAFKDNLHVGRLVKTICADIQIYLHPERDRDAQSDCTLAKFDKRNLEELLVATSKGEKLFVDTAIYTRNRHFRIYKSTKWGKQSHMVLASDCVYIPPEEHPNEELGIFLDSLISYFPEKDKLVLLEYKENDTSNASVYTKGFTQRAYTEDVIDKSPYPSIDEFILKTVSPGKIRCCKYFPESKTLTYEILGNRYCYNIGRAHKSNNVYWVVDLNKKVMYQKCHDEDCAGFKSEPQTLPEKLWLQIDEDTDEMLLSLPNPEK